MRDLPVIETFSSRDAWAEACAIANDIAAEHLRWYAQHPSVVAAGLRRHEHLIQRLGLSA